MNKANIIIKRLLRYVDDVKPANRQEIIKFFNSINAPYRQDYINFLSEYGGNNPSFLRMSDMNCSFNEIRDLYKDNNNILGELCYFCSNAIDDPFYIKKNDGAIYYDGGTYFSEEDGNQYQLYGDMVYKNITSLLFYELIHNICFRKFLINVTKKENLSDTEVNDFTNNYMDFKITKIFAHGNEFFLIGKTLYSINKAYRELLIQSLSINLMD